MTFSHIKKITVAGFLMLIVSFILACTQQGTQKSTQHKINSAVHPKVSATVKKASAPNVIIIVADQMRRESLGIWQQDAFKTALNGVSDYVVTPHLDALAQKGAVFNQAIANYPLCSPFRAMLLSGRYPNNNGVDNNTRTDRPNVGLRLDITTLTESLASAGYNTALVGKGHWHNNLPLLNKRGEYVGTKEAPGGHYFSGTKYDTYIPPGEPRHGIEYWYQSIGHNHDSPTVYTNDTFLSGKPEGHPYYPKKYTAVNQANVIIDYIKNTRQQRDSEKPFSILWTMDPPHSPYKDLDDTDENIYNQYYKDVAIEKILNRPNVDRKRAEKFARIHFSMVTLIDREIGRLITSLKEQGLDKNTLIVFTSDHGEMMGSHGKMAKNVFYEESLGIPLIMYFDGVVSPHLNDLLIGVPDFMPTILGLLNLKTAIPHDIDGVDYSALIKTENTEAIQKPKSSLYYGRGGQLGVRTDKYLYALDAKGKMIALFDLKKDPYQLNNLTLNAIPSEDSAFLKRALGSWLNKINHVWAKNKKYTHSITYGTTE